MKFQLFNPGSGSQDLHNAGKQVTVTERLIEETNQSSNGAHGFSGRFFRELDPDPDLGSVRRTIQSWTWMCDFCAFHVLLEKKCNVAIHRFVQYNTCLAFPKGEVLPAARYQDRPVRIN